TIGRTIISIVAQSGPDSEIAKRFYSSYLLPRRNGAKKILESAITKGEIRNNLFLELVMDMLFGPIYFRILVYKDTPSVQYIECLVDQVLEGIAS
ncbi:MAG: TetR-like C-terminal domain-containing protein, partial [Bacillota bacterium]|nr:TetR-like C-terminal domain-containing protein [Bacillota bacterium]